SKPRLSAQARRSASAEPGSKCERSMPAFAASSAHTRCTRLTRLALAEPASGKVTSMGLFLRGSIAPGGGPDAPPSKEVVERPGRIERRHRLATDGRTEVARRDF